MISEASPDTAGEDLFNDLDTLDFNTDDGLQTSEPDLELNLSDEDSNDEDTQPPASVPESDSPKPIIFDEEANQGHPVGADDEKQDDSTDQSYELDVPTLPEPDPSDLDSSTPGLPEIGSLPEPPYEVELNTDPPYEFAFELDDDNMGDG